MVKKTMKNETLLSDSLIEKHVLLIAAYMSFQNWRNPKGNQVTCPEGGESARLTNLPDVHCTQVQQGGWDTAGAKVCSMILNCKTSGACSPGGYCFSREGTQKTRFLSSRDL